MKKLVVMMMTLSCLMVAAQDEAPAHPERRGPGHHLSQMDSNGDGAISAEEFAAGTQAHFQKMDANGDGVISEDELPQRPMRQHKKHRMGAKLIGLADSDRSGDISAEEWSAFLDAVTVEGSNEVSHEAIMEMVAARRGEMQKPPREHRGERGQRGERGDHHGVRGDLNGDGVFDTEDLNGLFAKMDADGDGQLSAEELPRRHPGMR